MEACAKVATINSKIGTPSDTRTSNTVMGWLNTAKVSSGSDYSFFRVRDICYNKFCKYFQKPW